MWLQASRRYTRTSSVALYSGIFLFIISLVAVGNQPPEHSSAAASAVELSTAREALPAATADELVAANIAANIAQTADLPVASNVSNLSQSLSAESVLTQNDTNIVAKPQIVEPTADSREIKTYTTKTGDTVPAIAKKFNVSAQTIKWVNSLNSDALEANRKLKILPVDGVLVKAKEGDTIEGLANRYGASAEQLKAFNDLEISGIKANDMLIIPNGELPENQRPGYTAPIAAPSANSYASQGQGSVSQSTAVASAGNRYAFGNCTWYAYERRLQLGKPVGSFWGNATTWAVYGSAAGRPVNGTPAPGAIMQNGGGYGHVAIVESVNPGVSVTISEMNAYRFGGGFNIVAQGDIPWSQATSGKYRYIH